MITFQTAPTASHLFFSPGLPSGDSSLSIKTVSLSFHVSFAFFLSLSPRLDAMPLFRLHVFLFLGIGFGSRCSPVNWLRPSLLDAAETQLRRPVPQILKVLLNADERRAFFMLSKRGTCFGLRVSSSSCRAAATVDTAQPDELTHRGRLSVVPVGMWC